MTVMKPLNQFLRAAALIFAFLLLVFCSYAQPIQQAQFNSFMRTTLFWGNNSGLANYEHKYRIVMKDGTESVVESKIYTDEKLRKSYLLKINKDLPKEDSSRKERIYVDETLSIRRSDVKDKNKMITGIATDSCWQFKLVSGHISAYSFLSENYGLTTEYLAFFQVQNGPIEPLTHENLEAVIKDDEKAYKVFKRKNYYKAILLYNETHH